MAVPGVDEVVVYKLGLAGFVLAGAANILGILFSNRFFMNDKMHLAWPGLFGKEGCAVICIWGLAYISVCTSYSSVPYLVLLFGVEKAFYTLAWFVFLARKAKLKKNPEQTPVQDYSSTTQSSNQIPRPRTTEKGFFTIPVPSDVEPALFGVIDGFFMIFFFNVAFITWFSVYGVAIGMGVSLFFFILFTLAACASYRV